jgi:malate dehydrogenase
MVVGESGIATFPARLRFLKLEAAETVDADTAGPHGDGRQIDNNSAVMSAIAILGAGELGGSLAHLLARRDIASTIHLIDEAGRVAEGKALDITQSAPIEGFAARVSGSTQLAHAAGADVVFIADRAAHGEWQDDAGVQLLGQIVRLGAKGVTVCAGASQRLMVERGVRELEFSRDRLFGSAPEALAAAVRAVAAIEAGVSARDVALTVLGVPPAAIVVPWEESSIGGFRTVGLLDQAARRRLAAKVSPLWPPGPYALAAAAASVAAGILGRSRQKVSAFVGPDDANGRKVRAAALPVRLGPQGVLSVEWPALNPHDRVALESAMML